MSHRAQRSGSSSTGSRQLNFPFLSSTTGRDEAAQSSPLSRSRTERRSDAAQLQRANSGTEPATAPSSHSCVRDGPALTRSLHPHRIPPPAHPIPIPARLASPPRRWQAVPARTTWPHKPGRRRRRPNKSASADPAPCCPQPVRRRLALRLAAPAGSELAFPAPPAPRWLTGASGGEARGAAAGVSWARWRPRLSQPCGRGRPAVTGAVCPLAGREA